MATEAEEIILALVELGGLLAKARSKTPADWASFIKSEAYRGISKQTQQRLLSLTPDKLDNAIAQIRARKVSLLNNRPVGQLSRPQFDQHLALENAELQVTTAKHTAGNFELFSHWLTTHGLTAFSTGGEELVKALALTTTAAVSLATLLGAIEDIRSRKKGR
jgi:hypothetical protein